MIYSKYLQKEIPAERIQGMMLIRHSFLEEFAAEHNVEFTMHVVAAELDHAVVTCKLPGIYTIGEATEKTMWGKLDHEYPVTVAWNRAFDRAMIRLLDLNVPAFSNKEINLNNLKKQAETTMTKPVETKAETKAPAASNRTNEITEDDVILFGTWEGQRFRDVMQKKEFLDFCRWAKNNNPDLPDVECRRQLEYMKRIV